MTDILAGLNPAQREAVQTVEGPLLILAGPGSGKTRVITHRIAYLIDVERRQPAPHHGRHLHQQGRPRDAGARLQRSSGRGRPRPDGGHLPRHLRPHPARRRRAHRRRPRTFVIYDDDDQTEPDQAQRSRSWASTPSSTAPRAVLSAISRAKSELAHARRLRPARRAATSRRWSPRVYERYQELLAESSALDFDDLLMKTVAALPREPPDVLDKYQERYLHVLVDEFQDTNIVQYELVKQLAGESPQHLRRRRPRPVHLLLALRRPAQHPQLREGLPRRQGRAAWSRTTAPPRPSSRRLSSVISRQPAAQGEEPLDGERGRRAHRRASRPTTSRRRPQFVVSEVDKPWCKGDGLTPGDFAVMYRTNAQSRALEEAFVRYGMPYQLVGGTRFYERREIKDVSPTCASSTTRSTASACCASSTCRRGASASAPSRS